MKTVVFRQTCIYGTRQFGIEDQGWVAWFCVAVTTGQPFTIFGDGKQIRDALWVGDLIDAYERAIERIDAAVGPGLQRRRRAGQHAEPAASWWPSSNDASAAARPAARRLAARRPAGLRGRRPQGRAAAGLAAQVSTDEGVDRLIAGSRRTAPCSGDAVRASRPCVDVRPSALAEPRASDVRSGTESMNVPCRSATWANITRPAPGGIETHVRTLAQAQAELGATVRVFCVNHERGPDGRRARRPGRGHPVRAGRLGR